MPNFAVDLLELRNELDFGDVSGARQADRVIADDARGRPRRHDDDPVGERDCLFQIVGHEYYRLAVV